MPACLLVRVPAVFSWFAKLSPRAFPIFSFLGLAVLIAVLADKMADGWDAEKVFGSTVFGFTYDDIILMPGNFRSTLRRFRQPFLGADALQRVRTIFVERSLETAGPVKAVSCGLGGRPWTASSFCAFCPHHATTHTGRGRGQHTCEEDRAQSFHA